MDVYKESLKLHKEKKGKLEIKLKVPLKDKKDLSLAYTPGVAEVSREIAKDKSKVYDYTIKGNSVAVVSDGSSVLGLGNIGGYAAIPVMEGKAILFKEFAGIDAFPICLESDKNLVENIRNIAPVFGGINLEDIAAPKCFEIEAALQDIGIPVMHDDQHGTAIVILAALINAAKVTGKSFYDLKIVINGAGAAGTAIAKLLACHNAAKGCIPVKDIIMCDSKGIIYGGRPDLNRFKQELARITNKRKLKGSLKDALKGADVFVGVSVANVLAPEMIKAMNKDAIVFAMANPVPEIMPDLALKAGAKVVGTGRSDFPNQINNVLAFPGVFRGALDAKATKINEEMKLAAAYALANYIKNPTVDHFIPNPLDKGVVKVIAKAVKEAAIKSKVIR